MIYKVHWIVDGVAEIEADSKEDAEKKLQESLEDYVKKIKTFDGQVFCKIYPRNSIPSWKRRK